MATPEKWAEALKVIGKINKKKEKDNPFAPPAIRFASEIAIRDLVSTGNLSIDRAIGGGVKRGSLVEIAGDEGVGKTSMLMSWIAEVQAKGELALYFLTEGKFDYATAEKCGVDIEKLLVINCMGYVEKHLDDLKNVLWDSDKQIPRNLFSLIAIDSISAFEAKQELDSIDKKGIEGDTVGVQARLMSKLFRVIVGGGMVGDTNIAWITQTRNKIVLMGDPRTTSGGKAPGFYATYKLWLKAEKIKDKKTITGQIVHFTVTKNNSGMANPYATGDYTVDFATGLDNIGGLVDACIEDGLIAKDTLPLRGNPLVGSFEFVDPDTGEITKIKGRDNVKDLVRSDARVYKILKDKFMATEAKIDLETAEEAEKLIEVSGGEDSEEEVEE